MVLEDIVHLQYFGINTRRYHGLLVAPLLPPAKRFLILSKVDESIEFTNDELNIQNQKYNLGANMCKNYIGDGYRNLVEFEKKYMPIFKYIVNGIEITKIVCMEYGKNTVGIYYKFKKIEKKTNKKENIENVTNEKKFNKIKLTLAPIINFRDFHSINTNYSIRLSEQIKKNKVELVVDENYQTPIYLNVKINDSNNIDLKKKNNCNINYIEHFNDIFKNMTYIEEEKRGFENSNENHIVSRSL